VQSRRQYVAFFSLVALVLIAGILLARSRRPQVSGALTAVPHDAWLVAKVDVAALRESPLAKPVLGSGSATIMPGLGSLGETCGFDPVARLRELVVASPEGGERGDFGVAFAGEFSKDELASCADKVIRARGGRPSTSTRGDFTVIEDGASGKRARVAYREGGPFLVGRGSWLDAMIDAADGKGERERPEHGDLRRAFEKRGGPAGSVLVTAVLPKALRERLKAELAEQAGANAPTSPSDADRAYASVLAVEQAGLSLASGGPGSTTNIAVELRCESQPDCEAVRDLAERKRLALSRDFGVRILGLGPLLDTLTVEVHGTSLVAAAHAPTDDLSRVLQRAADLQSLRPPPQSPSAAPAPTPSK
jgi:hypothetical protein